MYINIEALNELAKTEPETFRRLTADVKNIRKMYDRTTCMYCMSADSRLLNMESFVSNFRRFQYTLFGNVPGSAVHPKDPTGGLGYNKLAFQLTGKHLVNYMPGGIKKEDRYKLFEELYDLLVG